GGRRRRPGGGTPGPRPVGLGARDHPHARRRAQGGGVMSDTTRAGTLRAPRSPGEYLEAKRENEWVHRWFLREALRAQAAEYRGLFEKEQQERAKALAALHDDLVRAHERIADQERALEAYQVGTWESRLQLRWARVKLAVRALFRIAAEPEAEVKRMLDDYR